MNADPKTTNAVPEAEPTSTFTTMPVWPIVVMLVLLFWGALTFDRRGGWFEAKVYQPYHSLEQVRDWQPKSGTSDLFETGRRIYNKPTCGACHQANGLGTAGQFPKLAGSDWVLEPGPGRIIRAVLHGMQGGPIKINGESLNFSAAMVPWKDSLNDNEIAAVLTYIRRDWGNNAPDVKPEQVKAVREKTKDRTTAYTPDELMQISPAE